MRLKATGLSHVLCSTLIAAVLATASEEFCPVSCTCRDDGPESTSLHVQCVGLGFREAPSKTLPLSATHLDLSRNQLVALTTATFYRARALTSLNLSRNSIETVEEGTFGLMQALETLDLSGNRLVVIREGIFSGATLLKELDLSSNRLTHIDGAFSNLTNLTTLDLRENALSALTEFAFRDLESLRYLHLTSNRIQRVDRRAFRGQQRLLYLVMRDNPLGDLVTRFYFNSMLLSYIDLSECQLTQVPRGLSESVRYLQLRRNNLTSLTAKSFSDCPYVNILVLDENHIERVEEGTFEGMTHLQQLWLNDNRMRELPRSLPPSLKRLLMDANDIGEITNVFPPRSQLTMLSLVSNRISLVSPDSFSALDAAQSIDLSQNLIARLEPGTFANNAQVRTLYLSKNPLQTFSPRCFQGLVGLRSLSLGFIEAPHEEEEGDWETSRDSLEAGMAARTLALPGDLFQPLTRLSRLELDNSPGLIASILASDPVLGGLSKLQELSMVGSDLTALRPDFPVFFPALGALRISSVRWHCDKSLLWFRDYLLTSGVKIDSKVDITCFTPRSVHGRSLIGLADSEFAATTTTTTTTTPSVPVKTANGGVLKNTNDEDMHIVSEPLSGTKAAIVDTFNEDGWKDYEVSEPEYILPNNADRDYLDDAHKTSVSINQNSVFTRQPTKNQNSNDIIDPNIKRSDERDDVNMIPTISIFGSTKLRSADKVLSSANSGHAHTSPNNDHSTSHDGLSHKNVHAHHDSPNVAADASSRHHEKMAAEDDALDPLKVKIIIIVTTIATTLIIAAVILALTVCVWNQNRRKRNRIPEDSAGKSERTVIKYRNKNGVLYFSTPDGKAGVQNSAQSLLIATPMTFTMTSPMTSAEQPMSESAMPEFQTASRPTTPYSKTHVYKWEDF